MTAKHATYIDKMECELENKPIHIALEDKDVLEDEDVIEDEKDEDVDDEWEQYLLDCENFTSSVNHNSTLNNKNKNVSGSNINDETTYYKKWKTQHPEPQLQPASSPLIVSTKSKEIPLNTDINLDIFWKIPLVSYNEPGEGIIKKQIQFKYRDPDEYARQTELKEKAKEVPGCKYLNQRIMEHMDIQISTKRKFYHKSIVSFGVNSKDILGKSNTAFKNSFVLIIRLALRPNDVETQTQTQFHEYNVKIFNTGKITFTGIKDDETLNRLFKYVMDLLKTYSSNNEFKDYSTDATDYKQTIILVNSNFRVNYCINQNKLRQILTTKYGMLCKYNSGYQYAGLSLPFYYDTTKSLAEQTGICENININNDRNDESKNYDILINDVDNNDDEDNDDNDDDTIEMNKNGKKNKTAKLVQMPNYIVRVSCAIFRTGSILISGKCDDKILNATYDFISKLVIREFPHIYMGETEEKPIKQTKSKVFWKKEYDME